MLRWFTNLAVGRKLTLGFALVLSLTLLITLASWNSMNGLLERSYKLSELARLGALTKELRIARLRYQANRDAQSQQDVQDALKRLVQLKQDLQPHLSDPRDLELLAEQGEQTALYQTALDTLVRTFNEREQARQQLVANAELIGRDLGQLMDRLARDSLLPGDEMQRLATLRQVAEATLAVQHARLLVSSYVSSDNPQAKAPAEAALDTAESEVLARRAALPAEYQNEVDEAVEALKRYRQSLAAYGAALDTSLVQRQAMIQQGDRIEAISGDLSQRQLDKRSQETARTRTLMVVIALMALLLGSGAAWFITRMIVRPLRDTLEAAERIATGDLSRDIQVNRSDELGQLQRSMQAMSRSLRELIEHIRDGVTQIASAAEELSAVTEQTSAGVNNQKVETDQVATAMNEMAATVHEVARNAEEASEAANSADQQARSGARAVTDAVQRMDQLAAEVGRSNDAVAQLKQESEKIGSVLDVIKAVAEQTNLLALNAAIEAARAGEAGRGFAVVADEVRGLAQRTQNSTAEIESLIAGLQSGTQQAAQLMDNSRQLTDSTLQLTRAAGERLGAIADAASTIQAMNQQIATAAEEQSAVAEEINRSVVNVRDISEQTAAASEETAASSIELARLGNELQVLVSRFRT